MVSAPDSSCKISHSPRCGRWLFLHLLAIDFRSSGKQVTYISFVVEGIVLILPLQPLSELQVKTTVSAISKNTNILLLGYSIQHYNITNLISLGSLELLELALKAEVGASRGPDNPDGRQGLLPAQSCHCHDVSYHQGDTAGHTC